jgi:hypothetical protein
MSVQGLLSRPKPVNVCNYKYYIRRFERQNEEIK